MTFAWRNYLRAAVLATGFLAAGGARAATDIDLFFPVPVDGQLARDMATLIKQFNAAHPDIKATPVFTGTYDETLIKTRSATQAGKPPAAVIMSANFLTDLVIEDEIVAFDDLIANDGSSDEKFMTQFFPALHGNAVIDRKVYGVPFQNSTPLLYYNADQFREVGLDPERAPQTWDELVAAAKKLTKREGDRVTRWGILMPSNYDYGGWILSALTMSNGGRYFNEEYGGEIYYDTATTLGALTFWSDLVHKHKVHAAGEQKAPAISTAFLSGQVSMMLLSTGSLTHIRTNAKFPYKVAFVPKNVRNAVPIGGGSLVQPRGLDDAKRAAGWTLIKWLTAPEQSGWWSRGTGYFAPNMGAYKLPAMEEFLTKNPDAKIAIDQLAFAKPWFATYKTVAVRKAMEDELQAVLAGKKSSKDAVTAAQRAADEIMRPYVERTALKVPATN
jgi:sn-glycerol 3-phosphate transport system substrate-binding protein